ncbi:hypothetical protein D0Z07_4094 [Hyphodiscus hymeniophilus]|uniref:Uncharacterized protein n=1 Tax=Hyphodiscus hymeniophilus TaxID=353542 RepID=A0A9P6VKG4_9HELO|nr:hypothetical protein D0Z07_4094 [Hyphodiscus hymeniophilus]
METEESSQAHFQNLEEDSGSAYEDSDEEQASSSQNEVDEEHRAAPPSRTKPLTARDRSGGRASIRRDLSTYQHTSPSISRSRDTSLPSQRDELRLGASDWAATFEAPESPTDIRLVPRHEVVSKRRAVKPPSQIRAKRLKSWYSPQYRDLLNLDIYDTVSKSVTDFQKSLQESQIGCSIWNPKEKDVFFSAVSRLGRDNVRGIAARIETKSEMEVHEYIQLLHEGMIGQHHTQKLLDVTELSAAMDISEECCGILERAGDALASRQERAEEEVEKGKWNDLWLLNSETDNLLRRKLDRKEVEETLPAVNLFVLGNWLELSRRVFMNSNSDEGNWEDMVEEGETPAIRATAFEDFYSLAISVTKRLVSATLFCTMSRLRATGSPLVRRANVDGDDVGAAIKVLGLKANSREFWIGCSRRCNLKVFDEEWNSFMSYEEVEKSLRETRERSRSRSASRHARSVSRPLPGAFQEAIPDSESGSEDSASDEYSPSDQSVASDNEITDYSTETEAPSRKDFILRKAAAKVEAENAHEAYIEAFDNEQSRLEEQRMWTLLGQTAPFEIKDEPMDLPDPPKGNFRDDIEQANWRNHLDFRSQWEELETPVPTAKLERNRMRVSKRFMRRRKVNGRQVRSSEGSEDGDFNADSDDVNERNRQLRDDSEILQDELDGSKVQEDREEGVIGSEDERDEAHEIARDGSADRDKKRAPDELDTAHSNTFEPARPDTKRQVDYLYPASVSHSPISEDGRIKREYDSSE